MAELSTNDRLKQAQARVKVLSGNRDQILGDLREGELKLKQTYESLRGLGVESPETLSPKQLQALGEEYKTKLALSLETLEEALTKGESLMQQYKDLEESE